MRTEASLDVMLLPTWSCLRIAISLARNNNDDNDNDNVNVKPLIRRGHGSIFLVDIYILQIQYVYLYAVSTVFFHLWTASNFNTLIFALI